MTGCDNNDDFNECRRTAAFNNNKNDIDSRKIRTSEAESGGGCPQVGRLMTYPSIKST